MKSRGFEPSSVSTGVGDSGESKMWPKKGLFGERGVSHKISITSLSDGFFIVHGLVVGSGAGLNFLAADGAVAGTDVGFLWTAGPLVGALPTLDVGRAGKSLAKDGGGFGAVFLAARRGARASTYLMRTGHARELAGCDAPQLQHFAGSSLFILHSCAAWFSPHLTHRLMPRQ